MKQHQRFGGLVLAMMLMLTLGGGGNVMAQQETGKAPEQPLAIIITGHVTLTGGQPVANAGIYIGKSSTGTIVQECGTYTDANGYYDTSRAGGSPGCPGLRADVLDLHVLEAQGYPGQVWYNTNVTGNYVQNFTLRNGGDMTIRGVTRDYNLNPLSGVRNEAFQGMPAGYQAFFRILDSTSSNGTYNFTSMDRERDTQYRNYVVYASKAGYKGAIYVEEAPASGDLVLDFKLGVFNDVLPGSGRENTRVDFPFYFVEFMRANNIIAGFTQGSQCPGGRAPCFLPNNNVRRGEYSKMLVLAKGWAINTAGGPHFNDVPTSNIFYGVIETAFNQGAIQGYGIDFCGGSPCFRPNSDVNRGEAAKISVAASGWTLLNPPTPSYSDVPTTHFAYRYIETARARGANANDAGGQYRPSAPMTRAETAKLVCVANAYQRGCQTTLP